MPGLRACAVTWGFQRPCRSLTNRLALPRLDTRHGSAMGHCSRLPAAGKLLRPFHLCHAVHGCLAQGLGGHAHPPRGHLGPHRLFLCLPVSARVQRALREQGWEAGPGKKLMSRGRGIRVSTGEGSREVPEGWGEKDAGGPHPIHPHSSPSNSARMAPLARSHGECFLHACHMAALLGARPCTWQTHAGVLEPTRGH